MPDQYYLSEHFADPNFGGIKARNDIDRVLQEKGLSSIPMHFCHFDSRSITGRAKNDLASYKNWRLLSASAKEGSIVIIQYPFGNPNINIRYMRKARKNNGYKFICIIHDLQSLQDQQVPQETEIELLNLFDSIICHNPLMKAKLVELGINPSKLIVLGLFDYFTDAKPRESRDLNEGLVVAGNLAPFKASYVYKFASTCTIPITLYGPNYDASINPSIHYVGSLPADELIGVLQGAFGVVWDGDSVSECNGTFGNYQKINNPHRVSMYLAAQIPLFIWNKAALRDFIVENNLGFGIDSLTQIQEIYSSLSTPQYQKMLEATKQISAKLRNGSFTSKAIDEALRSTISRC